MNTIWIWYKKISKNLINVWSLQFLWICSKNKLCSLIKPHNYALCVPKEFWTLYEKVLRQNLRALYSTLILLVTYFLFKIIGCAQLLKWTAVLAVHAFFWACTQILLNIIDLQYVAWEIPNSMSSNLHSRHASNSFNNN